jgi:hypothetical protein
MRTFELLIRAMDFACLITQACTRGRLLQNRPHLVIAGTLDTEPHHMLSGTPSIACTSRVIKLQRLGRAVAFRKGACCGLRIAWCRPLKLEIARRRSVGYRALLWRLLWIRHNGCRIFATRFVSARQKQKARGTPQTMDV